MFFLILNFLLIHILFCFTYFYLNPLPLPLPSPFPFPSPSPSPPPPNPPPPPVRPLPISNIPLAGLTMVNWPAQPFMPTAASPSGAFPITSGVAAKIPWFGLPDSIFPMAQRRGVTMLGGALPSSKAAPLQLAQSGTVPPDPRAASYATPIQILKPTVATDPKKIIPFTKTRRK